MHIPFFIQALLNSPVQIKCTCCAMFLFISLTVPIAIVQPHVHSPTQTQSLPVGKVARLFAPSHLFPINTKFHMSIVKLACVASLVFFF